MWHVQLLKSSAVWFLTNSSIKLQELYWRLLYFSVNCNWLVECKCLHGSSDYLASMVFKEHCKVRLAQSAHTRKGAWETLLHSISWIIPHLPNQQHLIKQHKSVVYLNIPDYDWWTWELENDLRLCMIHVGKAQNRWRKLHPESGELESN